MNRKLKGRLIRLLSKLAMPSRFGGDAEHRTAVYTPVHEDLSTASTLKAAGRVEFGKKSIIIASCLITVSSLIADSRVSVSTNIAADVLDAVQISGLSNLNFGTLPSFSRPVSQSISGVCLYSASAKVQLTISSTGGINTTTRTSNLVSSLGNTVPFRLYLGSTELFSPTMLIFAANNNTLNCTDGNGRYVLTAEIPVTGSIPAGNYGATVTLQIAPY